MAQPTGTASASSSAFPASPFDGSTVSHSLAASSKGVAAARAAGSKTMRAFGVVYRPAIQPLASDTAPFWRWSVAGLEPSPLTFTTALNHSVLPAATAVPLKLEVMVDGAPTG